MVTLKQVGKRTYYVTGLFHVGVYVLEQEAPEGTLFPVCLIDSGLDTEYAQEIDAVLEEHYFRVQMIINTHYHADHSGGNAYFKEKYGCICVATKPNAALISNYDICPTLVWGAGPIHEIMNHYFYAVPTETKAIEEIGLPEGLHIEFLPGHCIAMIAVGTSDGVLFLGDAVIGADALRRHSLSYIYEIDDYLKSLEKLEYLKAELYIPYHAEPTVDIVSLVEANRRSVMNNIAVIKDICKVKRTLDEIYSIIYNRCGYEATLYRYAMESSILRTYLSYLHNCGEIQTVVEDNFIKWYVSDDL